MLRVLTLSTLFPDVSRPVFGSFVERQTLELANHTNVELRVVAPIGIPPWPLSLHPKYSDLRRLPAEELWKGLTVHRPRFAHIPSTGGRFDSGMLVRSLKPVLTSVRRDFAFDVIDAEFFFPDGPAAIALGKYFNVPVSIKARGSDIHFWGLNPETSQQIIAAGRTASGVLAVSEAIKSDMIALGMPGERIKVHYTGVDLDRFQPLNREATKADLGITGPLICCIGTLNANKGQHVLIDALTGLPGMSLVLIGKGPDEGALRSLVQEKGLANRVIFTGSLPADKVTEWLGAADVMALPSASEGLANVWVEALACGTPVVTCDVGGAREVIDQTRYGHLVDRNPHAFSQAIQAVIDAPPNQADVRSGAERFTWSRNTDALFDHLSNLRAV